MMKKNAVNWLPMIKIGAAAAVLGLLVTGCTSSPVGEVEPAWKSDQPIKTVPLSSKAAKAKLCMEDQGFVVHDTGRGGLVSDDLTPEQSALYGEAMEECAEAIGLYDPLTVAEQKELYLLELENRQCLLDNGYESGTPPSEQAYLETWKTMERPYDSLTIVFESSPALFMEATNVCPSPRWSIG